MSSGSQMVVTANDLVIEPTENRATSRGRLGRDGKDTMMNPEVSRACAALKNALNLAPGPELDRLIKAAETARSLDDLPAWVKNGLRKIKWPGV